MYVLAPCIFVTVVGSLVYDQSYCTLCIYLHRVYLLQWLGHWCMISRDIFVTVVGSLVYYRSYCTPCIFAPCIFVTVVGSLVYDQSYCAVSMAQTFSNVPMCGTEHWQCTHRGQLEVTTDKLTRDTSTYIRLNGHFHKL